MCVLFTKKNIMRIAFASCFHSKIFPDQPVWDWIAAKNPDHLVLLGDSIYLDVDAGDGHPNELTDDEFAKRLFRLYCNQMNQPSFKSLIQSLPLNRVWSIWDDHDFLWNNATGYRAGINPHHKGKIRLSTAFQEAFRFALSHGLFNGSFPSVYNDPKFWNAAQPPLTTPSVALEPDLWLHLSDGRTNRTEFWPIPESKRHLLGFAQRNLFESRIITTSKSAVHLFASGSTAGEYKQNYAADWKWLTTLASENRLLILSGDIHRNETDAFFTTGFPLHEATSSGAAIKDTVVFGQSRRNFGLLDLSSTDLQIRLYADNKEESKWSRKLSRNTWLPI
jgi:alkaline phosphatase D